MEKNRCLEEVSTMLGLSWTKYTDLLKAIRKDVRKAAKLVEAFETSKNGSIRIRIEPLCKAAAAWLDGCSEKDVDLDDFGMREFVYKIHPLGSHTITWTDEADGHSELVSCYSYSALKIAFLDFRQKYNPEVTPEQPGYFTEDNGWSPHRGPVSGIATYETTDGSQIVDVFRLTVCVSGATSVEDEACAVAGINAAADIWRSFCINTNGFIRQV